MAVKKLRLVKNLDLSRIHANDLEYFCISDEIDREVSEMENQSDAAKEAIDWFIHEVHLVRKPYYK